MARLQAVVIGAGWAGEGHTLALRACGVDIVAICARNPAVVRAVADRLDIPAASIDWCRTLETVKPDIVALATPAALRGEVVEHAATVGAHLFCDKPLAATAAEARRLYLLARDADIKHAYAATHRYDPAIAWLAELVREGVIGELQQIEYSLHLAFPAMAPWGWWSMSSAGGGFMHNWLPHLLGILKTVTGGEILRVTGFTQTEVGRAPVIPGVHDFRQLIVPETYPPAEEMARLEWRETESDWAFKALITLSSSYGEIPVSVSCNIRAAASWPPDGFRLYGSKGILLAEGFAEWTIACMRADGEREPSPVPQRLLDALPQAGNGEQNKWTALARDFLADVRGEPHNPYLTFYDGWRFQEAMDAIRAGQALYTLPT